MFYGYKGVTLKGIVYTVYSVNFIYLFIANNVNRFWQVTTYLKCSMVTWQKRMTLLATKNLNPLTSRKKLTNVKNNKKKAGDLGRQTNESW